MSYHGIIFTGMQENIPSKSIGPYRLRTVASKVGYNIKVVDYFPDWFEDELEQLLENIVNKDTLFIAISSTFLEESPHGELFLRVAARIKQKFPKLQTLLGGARSIYWNRQFGWDWVISGYSDNSIVKFLDHLSGKNNTLIYEKKTRSDSKGRSEEYYWVDSNKNHGDIDMGHLMTEWRDDDDIRPTDTLPIEISRGCIFKCTFCYFPLNGKAKFDYFRHKEELVKEFQTNYERFGVNSYTFMDDTYNDSREKLQLMDQVYAELPSKIEFATYIKPELLVSWPETQQQLVEQGLRGASMGVESFHPLARKMIAKGSTIEKIIDASKNLKKYSDGKVGTHWSMICGLPKEPVDSIRSTNRWFIKESKGIVDVWVWHAMAIQSAMNPSIYQSIIEKNPESFGYTITHDNGVNRGWKNEHMTLLECRNMVKRMSEASYPYRRVGGWAIGSLKNAGYNARVGVDILADLPWGDLMSQHKLRRRFYIRKQLEEIVQ